MRACTVAEGVFTKGSRRGPAEGSSGKGRILFLRRRKDPSCGRQIEKPKERISSHFKGWEPEEESLWQYQEVGGGNSILAQKD